MLMSRKVLQGSFCLLASFTSAAFAQSPRQPHSGQNNAAASPQIERNVYDASDAVVAATTTPVTGKFVANFTIKLVTAVPSGSEVVCALSASTDEISSTTHLLTNEIFETAGTKATVSGSTATCTVTIPYSWYLTTSSSDTVALSYTLEMANASAPLANPLSRYSSQFVPGAGAIKVPANGTTTTYTIGATL